MKPDLELLCEQWERDADDREDDALTYAGREHQPKLYREAETLRRCAAQVRALLAAQRAA